MLKSESVYFPNLNGLRFIAAAMVIVHHIEQIKLVFGFDSVWETSDTIRNIGKLGVLLFFTLSGFLITYLLLAEEKLFGDISIKQFYMRRILRIWPLYFLIFFLAFFVLNRISFFQFPNFNLSDYSSSTILILFLLFLSNVFLSFFGMLPYAAQTWSVAVEEQFYLIWPLIVKFSKNKILSISIIIFFIIIVRFFLMSNILSGFKYITQCRTFWNLFNIDCMGIGAILSIFLFTKSAFLKYFLNTYLFIVILCITVFMIAFNIKLSLLSIYFENDLYALLFGIIVLNLAANISLSKLLEFKWLNYLGKISFGLYMYHGIAIVISIKIFQKLNFYNSFGIYITTFIITFFISSLSYKYFETFFLNLKHKFSKVHSSKLI